jgi:hypothetical protein
MRQKPEIFSFGVPDGMYSREEFDTKALPFQMRQAQAAYPGVQFEAGEYLTEDGFFVYRCRGVHPEERSNEQ